MNDQANSVHTQELPDLQRFVRRHVKEAIHRATGRGGVPVKRISEAAGIDPARIYEHRNLTRSNVVPNAVDLINYTVECGADLINDMFAPFGFGGLHRIAGSDLCPMAVHSLLTGHAAMQADALADLIIEPSENAALRREGQRIATAILEFNRALDRRQREHWRLTT